MEKKSASGHALKMSLIRKMTKKLCEQVKTIAPLLTIIACTPLINSNGA